MNLKYRKVISLYLDLLWKIIVFFKFSSFFVVTITTVSLLFSCRIGKSLKVGKKIKTLGIKVKQSQSPILMCDIIHIFVYPFTYLTKIEKK